MKSHFTFQVEESEKLKTNKGIIPEGRGQFIKITALVNGVKVGKIILNISRISPSVKPSVNIAIHDMPINFSEYLEVARDLLTKTVIELKKRKVKTASFLVHKKDVNTHELIKNSGLFKKQIGPVYHFDVEGSPIVKQSAFGIRRRQRINFFKKHITRIRPANKKPLTNTKKPLIRSYR